MKIIIRVNTDDLNAIRKLTKSMKEDFVVPMDNSLIKIYVIDDAGKVQLLE